MNDLFILILGMFDLDVFRKFLWKKGEKREMERRKSLFDVRIFVVLDAIRLSTPWKT
jgi:hypothetical protein